jgi:sarcosine oxidase subunit beta
MNAYDAVIVGGGAVGLSTAYHLVKKGLKVAVLEKNYAGSGSSTRNGGGYRVHFGSEHNVRYMVEGRKRLLNLGQELGWNPTVLETGYLWLLATQAQIDEFRRLNRTWSSLGVPGKFIGVKAASELLPGANLGGLTEAFIGPQDGTFHHDLVVLGYQTRLREMGVEIFEQSPVEGFTVNSSKVTAARVGSKQFQAEKFVLCAGAWSSLIAQSAGVSLPITPERRELGVTEPIKYFIKPFTISPYHGIYLAQGLRGEIRGTVLDLKSDGFAPLLSTLEWTRTYAKRVTTLLPFISNIRLNRQWSGYYEMTPDHSQIMGSSSKWPEGFYVAAGFSGHGMMMSPLTGELMAENVADGRVPPLMEPYSPDRFERNRLIHEAMVF